MRLTLTFSPPPLNKWELGVGGGRAGLYKSAPDSWMRAHSRFHWATKAHAGHGDAAQTPPLLRSDCRAGGLQSVGGMVQAGGRSQLLLRGQGVRSAVRDPEVTARQEGGKPVRQRRDGDQQRAVWFDFSQLHPQDHGQYFYDYLFQLVSTWEQIVWQRNCPFSTTWMLSITRLDDYLDSFNLWLLD